MLRFQLDAGALEVTGMGVPKSDESAPKPGPDSEVVTTRVNVAFPFSQIRIEQPSEDLAALAELIRDLADLLADIAPSSKAGALGKRAQELAGRLK
jgi:hypothetical protein